MACSFDSKRQGVTEEDYDRVAVFKRTTEHPRLGRLLIFLSHLTRFYCLHRRAKLLSDPSESWLHSVIYS